MGCWLQVGGQVSGAHRHRTSGSAKRLRTWWKHAPLGVTFTVYLAVYLTVASLLAVGAGWLYYAVDTSLYTFSVWGDGLVSQGPVDSGPYVYDAQEDELVPAAEFMLPEGPYAVFVAFDGGESPDVESRGSDETAYATMDDVRAGTVKLLDWGLNYSDEYLQDDVLGDERGISADELAAYDQASREGRAQSIQMFDDMLGTDLVQTFSEQEVSNTAYYAYRTRPEGLLATLLQLLGGAAPFVIYGVLGWLTFRRFYRVYLAGPLTELECAAERIAESDLDFSIEGVPGRELGRLAQTLEDMRASLLAAQRELWHTAEERRRLNAAFAHDLRTPVTVLKGTVELMRMRLGRGKRVDETDLEKLGAQIARLERYASAMGGLTKLEDRVVTRETIAAGEVAERIRAHATEVVSAYVSEHAGCMLELDCSACAVPAGMRDDEVLWLDMSLAEEVLDNVLSNACGHAETVVGVALEAADGVLRLAVFDDGPGFSAESLHRGCDAFYSEAKSAEHFGLGLNISSVLAELHGGEVALANREPHGARVTATFGCAGA